MKKLAATILTAALCLGLSGCSDPEPVDRTESGELTDSDPRVEQDNSPYDEYQFEAGEGWNVTIDMTSDTSAGGFDAYVWLIGPDGAAISQNDDGGEGTNARITHTTTAKGTYTVRANSYDGEGRGAYQVHIVAAPGQ